MWQKKFRKYWDFRNECGRYGDNSKKNIKSHFMGRNKKIKDKQRKQEIERANSILNHSCSVCKVQEINLIYSLRLALEVKEC